MRGESRRWAETEVHPLGPQATGELPASPHFPEGIKYVWEAGSGGAAGSREAGDWQLAGIWLQTRLLWREGEVGGVTGSSARTTRPGWGPRRKRQVTPGRGSS